MSGSVTKREVFRPDTTAVVDADAVRMRMAQNIIEADSVEDILAANVQTGAVLSLKDDIDFPLAISSKKSATDPMLIDSVSFNDSDDQYRHEDAVNAYAVMVMGDGTLVKTGAEPIVIKLYRLAQKDAYPLKTPVRFIRTRTRGGFHTFDVAASASVEALVSPRAS